LAAARNGIPVKPMRAITSQPVLCAMHSSNSAPGISG